MILPVPFVSQYSIGRDSDGLSRACGAACVKMIIDFRESDDVDFLSIVREGQTIKGAYVSGIGWTHAGLAALLRNHNVGAYAEEFRSVLVDSDAQKFLPSPFEREHVERGIKKIAYEVEGGRPVIVSGIKQWKDVDKPHLMVCVGVDREEHGAVRGFFYHDPDDEDEQGESKFINTDIFRQHWRKFAIFIDK
ncbi:MAG: hypothetical protein JWN89_252 [Parcubacteria group bacterium]|nr:hypothetical protein [Parcubacteria group bacterium]